MFGITTYKKNLVKGFFPNFKISNVFSLFLKLEQITSQIITLVKSLLKIDNYGVNTSTEFYIEILNP